MPEFIYPPTVEVLQTFVGDSNPREPKSIKMSVRRWYILGELCRNFSDVSLFTDTRWRGELYREELKSWDAKPSDVEGCISTKTIKDIIEGAGISWADWKRDYLNFYEYNSKDNRISEKVKARLESIQKLQPFNSSAKSIQNDLKYLCAEGYLIDLGYKVREYMDTDNNSTNRGRQYELADEDRFLQLFGSRVSRFLAVDNTSETSQVTNLGLSNTFQSADSGLSDTFQDFANVFWESSYPNQRFYIHADYECQSSIAKDMGDYRAQLSALWAGEAGLPCRLTYRSASKNDVYTAIVYPVCIYYYQRAFYLCAYGSQSGEGESNWYNYRLDRFQSLEVLDWQSDLIPEDLKDKCNIEDDYELIDEIACELTRAYGFDIALPQKTMLLRFKKDFHDRYIQNTWRHNSFQPVEIDRIEEIFNLNRDEYKFIQGRIDRYRDDKYYKMNYRVGDNSVIMRLRAWCPNVEVLFPIDLRERMHDDIQQTWDLYRADLL